jgi:hypothetical protein
LGNNLKLSALIVLLSCVSALSGTFVNGRYLESTNSGSTDVNCLPYSGFTTGLTYWAELGGTVRWTNRPAGDGSAYYAVLTDSDSVNLASPYSTLPGTGGVTVTLKYWYTNAQQHEVTWAIIDQNDSEFSSYNDISNPGVANVTNTSTIQLAADAASFNPTQLLVYIVGPTGGGTNIAHIFIDQITATSSVASTSGGTNLPAIFINGVRR